VPDPWNAQLFGQGNGILLRCPDSRRVITVTLVCGHRVAQPHPLGVRFAAGIEVQPRVVGKNLDARSHDEHHEQQVEEVLPPEPPGESGVDRIDVVHRGARIARDEILVPAVAGHLAHHSDG
jgi:hypothetical protein